jgi:thymidylate synthase
MSNSWEEQYLSLLADILQNGDDRVDRTGIGTRAVFGRQLDIPVWKGFPLTTTKKTAFKAIKSELLWFIEGSTDERRLAEIHFGNRDKENKTIWTANAEADYWKPKARFDGDLGNVYGAQWRGWNQYQITAYEDHLSHGDQGDTYFNAKVRVQKIDQLQQAIDKIKSNPTDRRIIVSAWNPAEIQNMALPPCHSFFQFFVDKDRRLSLQMYQRSVDTMLGLPFNIASYALLLEMVAAVTGCTADRLIMSLGDTHLYSDHLEGARLQLQREPMNPPKIWLNPEIKRLEDFTMDDIRLDEYESHDPIKLKMAV